MPVLSVEAASTFGWERYADESIGIDRFGASAPGELVLEKLGINVDNVVRACDTHWWLKANGAVMTDRQSLKDLYDEQGQSPWLDNLQARLHHLG